MKNSVIEICGLMNAAAQTESLEKQSISIAQQIPVSDLDARLPNRPFVAWLNELVGRDAEVVWQMAECGASESGQDMPACPEVSVQRGCGRGAPVGLQTDDAQRQPPKVETVLIFTFAPGFQ